MVLYGVLRVHRKRQATFERVYVQEDQSYLGTSLVLKSV